MDQTKGGFLILKYQLPDTLETAISKAVLRLKGETNLSYIQVIKKLGGSIK